MALLSVSEITVHIGRERRFDVEVRQAQPPIEVHLARALPGRDGAGGGAEAALDYLRYVAAEANASGQSAIGVQEGTAEREVPMWREGAGDDPGAWGYVPLAAVAVSGDYGDLTDVPETFPPAGHQHTESDISDLGDYLPLGGGALTGPLALPGDPTEALHAAPRQYVDARVAGLVDSSPEALDTLNELAQALGDDPNFAATVSQQIGTLSGQIDTLEATKANTSAVPRVLPDLDDVGDLSGAEAEQALVWNGSAWVPGTVAQGSGNPFDQDLNTADEVRFAGVETPRVDAQRVQTPRLALEGSSYYAIEDAELTPGDGEATITYTAAQKNISGAAELAGSDLVGDGQDLFYDGRQVSVPQALGVQDRPTFDGVDAYTAARDASVPPSGYERGLRLMQTGRGGQDLGYPVKFSALLHLRAGANHRSAQLLTGFDEALRYRIAENGEGAWLPWRTLATRQWVEAQGYGTGSGGGGDITSVTAGAGLTGGGSSGGLTLALDEKRDVFRDSGGNTVWQKRLASRFGGSDDSLDINIREQGSAAYVGDLLHIRIDGQSRDAEFNDFNVNFLQDLTYRGAEVATRPWVEGKGYVSGVQNDGGGTWLLNNGISSDGNLRLRTLTGGDGIDITKNETGELTIAATRGITDVTSAGGGAWRLHDGVQSGSLRLRTLTAGAGISISESGNDLAITATGGGGGDGSFDENADYTLTGGWDFRSRVDFRAGKMFFAGKEVRLRAV